MKKFLKGLMAVGMLFGSTVGVSAKEDVSMTVDREYSIIGVSADYGKTLQLLGATEVAKEDQLIVDGVMINKYLNDGSDSTTGVYSSAKITPLRRGTGIEVEVVTPDNILNVSPETYANAAITSGMKDVKITVASARPVTGTGALTGIYALQDKQGKLNTENVTMAQDEMDLITDVASGDAEKNALMNAAVAEIKKEIAEKAQDGEDLDREEVKQIVTNVTNNYNIVLDEVALDLAVDLYGRFSTSDIAKDGELSKQLNKLQGVLTEQGKKYFEGLDIEIDEEGLSEWFSELGTKVMDFILAIFDAVWTFLQWIIQSVMGLFGN